MAEMHLHSIRVQMPDNVPVVLLKEVDGSGRTLPILIGHEEASAIARALQGVEPPRPLTHDLMRDLLTTVGLDVDAVVVTEMVDAIFYAELRLHRGEERYTVSSRPSDAIALAVRLGTPIYVEDDLLDSEAYVLQEDEEQEEVIEQFQKFIEDVRPEDFAS
ncbi:MAG TPA: bifunctional nuclease family protein [Acidimicrobiales bacterium]|nr:bifunctional nuclease family protein [Acidimicrobiales bacterium]